MEKESAVATTDIEHARRGHACERSEHALAEPPYLIEVWIEDAPDNRLGFHRTAAAIRAGVLHSKAGEVLTKSTNRR